MVTVRKEKPIKVHDEGRSFNEIESELGRDWQNARGTSSLDWSNARDASRDAYDRAHMSTGDKISANSKVAAGYLQEETGELLGNDEMAQKGRDLRNEGRVENGIPPKTTKPGTGGH